MADVNVLPGSGIRHADKELETPFTGSLSGPHRTTAQ